MRSVAVSVGLCTLLLAARGWSESPPLVQQVIASHLFRDWGELLDKYVDDRGRVRYHDVDRSAVELLLGDVGATSPVRDPSLFPTRAAQLAYYIDGYNVAMWASVLRRPHLKSVIDDKKAIFETTPFRFGDESLTLQQVEERLRKLGDPRVHMALNCASASCPELPRKAFTPEGLDAQLDEATRRFCNDPRNVAYDAQTNTASLSKIFEWYAADFGSSVISFIDRYRTQKIPAGAHVAYVEYDWRLNDQSLPR